MLKPINLKVNFRRGEYAVAADNSPIFSWGVSGEGEQAEYRIQVGFGGLVLWDSGFVKSDSTSVRYAGKPLASGAVIDWSVQIRACGGRLSSVAHSAFKTACFDDWNGKWICSPLEQAHEVLVFSKEISLSRIPERAALFYCGIGLSKAYINGCETNDYRLCPDFTNYQKECRYVTDIIDVSRLHIGKNRIDIAVAGGWRKNYGKYLDNISGDRKTEFMGNMCLNAQLMLFYGDETVTAATDDSWDSSTCNAVFSHLFDGECYDEFAQIKNAPAQYSDFVPDMFLPRVLEPIRIKKEIKPVMTYSVSGKTIFDFGENIAGVVRLRLKGRSNGRVCFTLKHAELLDEDGGLYTIPLRHAKATDSYISRGGDIDIDFTPEFTYHGFRYAQLETEGDFDGEAEALALQFYTDIDTDAYFRCGDPVMNEIYNIAVRTERDNIHSIASDCPQRDERMGWLNDATVRFAAMPYSFNIAGLFEKIAGDIANEQDEQGRITCTAPLIYGNRPADPVCSSYLIAAREHYRLTGSVSLIEAQYDRFVMWNEYLSSQCDDGIVNYSYYGDWAGPEDCCVNHANLYGIEEDSPEDYAPGASNSKYIPGIMVSAGCHYWNWRMLSDFAGLLGKKEDAQRFDREAKTVQKAYLDKWFEGGRVYNGSQACQAFSLYIGIIPEQFRQIAADIMAQSVIDAGMRIQTANITTPMLFDMLSQYGYTDMAWELMTKQDYPSIGYMIANGATTVWERFELKKDGGMNSHNHPMYGACIAWLWHSLAGLTTVVPNKKYCLCPKIPEKLLSFEMKIPLLCNEIYIRYEKKYEQKTLFVNVPFGMEIELEAGADKHILKSGMNKISLGM